MHRRTFLISTCAAAFASRLSRGNEQQRDDLPDPMTFGHLRGRFVYDGDQPEPKPLRITKDIDAFFGLRLFDESLLVHPRTSP